MNITNPKVKVPATGWEKVFNLLSVVVIVTTIVYVVQQFGALPEKIPTHFNAQGEVDGWGGKSTLYILPGITVLLFIALYFINKVPHIFNLPVKITEENAPRIYKLARTMMAIFNFETVLILSYVTWETIHAAQGGSTLGVWFMVAVFVIPLGTMALFIIAMRRENTR